MVCSALLQHSVHAMALMEADFPGEFVAVMQVESTSVTI